MMKRLLLATLGALACQAAFAFDYRGLSDNVVVYDAGSKESTPLFILLRGTPVEVIVTLDRWAKIREAGGGIGWVERGALTDRKQVIVTVPQAEIRQSSDPSSPVVFMVAKDVLLDVVDTPVSGWVKVRHRDGQTGFISMRSIWGI